MTQTDVPSETRQGKEGGLQGMVGSVRDLAGKNPATKALLDAAQDYASAQGMRLIDALGEKVGQATKRLTDVADGTSSIGEVAKGAQRIAAGDSPGKAIAKGGLGSMKAKVHDKVKGVFGGGGGGDKKSGTKEAVTIVEDIDVGVPVRVAYDQWTQFQEFHHYMKGVESVEETEEAKTTWRVKVAASPRSWQATTMEQVPDQRIAWTSEGAKGSTRGVVTFHPLGDNLTKVLLVMEYYPSGLFEKTGNLWRAQGRRARLDLKHFRRFISMQSEATGGWRGEIRDGEVIRSHEDDVQEEEQSAEGREGDKYDEHGAAPRDVYDDEAYHEGEEYEDEWASEARSDVAGNEQAGADEGDERAGRPEPAGAGSGS